MCAIGSSSTGEAVRVFQRSLLEEGALFRIFYHVQASAFSSAWRSHMNSSSPTPFVSSEPCLFPLLAVDVSLVKKNEFQYFLSIRLHSNSSWWKGSQCLLPILGEYIKTICPWNFLYSSCQVSPYLRTEPLEKIFTCALETSSNRKVFLSASLQVSRHISSLITSQWASSMKSSPLTSLRTIFVFC